MSITEFLLARIAEDEETFGPEPWLDPVGDQEEYAADAANRVLADCEVKRRIVENATSQHTSGPDWDDACRLLALPYADHPDYDPIWRLPA